MNKPIKLVVYSKMNGADNSADFGREAINSDTINFNGKYYLPVCLERGMEATVVDWDKDLYLKSELNRFALLSKVKIKDILTRKNGGLDIINIIRKLIFDKTSLSSGKEINKMFSDEEIVEFLNWLSQKINNEYPYCTEMQNNQFAQNIYKSGQKYSLGYILQNQHAVCRHLTLMYLAVLEYLRTTQFNENNENFLNRVESHFVADQIKFNNSTSGHAYVVSTIYSKNKNLNLIIDPTSKGHQLISIEDLILNKDEFDSSSRVRYVFSMMRIILKRNHINDLAIIERFRLLARQNPILAQIYKSLNKLRLY